MGSGVLMGKSLCLIGAAVVAGVGAGPAPLVVGAAVARSEAGSSVGSAEPLQASNSNGKISARAKTPRKRRGILIAIHSLCLLGHGGTARRVRILAPGGGLPASVPAAVESMTRPVYPPGVPGLESTGNGGCAVPRRNANGKKTPAGGRD